MPGADIVLHSTTKYIGGHSDVVGGALVTNDEEVDAAFGFLQNGAGACRAFDAYLTMRGAQDPAAADAAARQTLRPWPNSCRTPTGHHGAVPGATRSSGHRVAARQMRGFGGMISIRMAGGIKKPAGVAPARAFSFSPRSLGGVESLTSTPVR